MNELAFSAFWLRDPGRKGPRKMNRLQAAGIRIRGFANL